MKKLFLLILSAILTGLHGQAQEDFRKVAQHRHLEEYELLSNGLRIILAPDKSFPVAHVQVVYRVGSKNEVPGQTGSTHLLEHLLFKRTAKFNPATSTITDTLQRYGAMLNATTWNDRTNYFELVPRDRIELALAVEADRMRSAILTEEDKASEMTVVRNEFEQGENNPLAVLDKEIWATAYLAHPYHHPTIGWLSDIENSTVQSLKNFYDTFYWPNNATLTVVGDFQKEEVFRWISTYFGKLAASPRPIPTATTQEPTQHGPRTVTVRRSGQTAVFSRAYKVPGVLHADYPALNLLGQYLGGSRVSVFQRQLIDTGLALDASASPTGFRDVNLFQVTLTSIDQKTALLESKWKAILGKLIKEGMPASELSRLKQAALRNEQMRIDGAEELGAMLTEAVASGNWIAYLEQQKAIEKVTPADIKRVLASYFQESQSTTGYFYPTEAGRQQVAQQAASGKCYYRTPIPATDPALPSIRYEKLQIGATTLYAVQTQADGFVTIAGTLSAGSWYTKNPLVPAIYLELMQQGTKKTAKYAFAEKLEALGVAINFTQEHEAVGFNFKCLTPDAPKVFQLLAEAFQQPLLAPAELALLKSQMEVSLREQELSPTARIGQEFTRHFYAKGHPYYSLTTAELLAALKQVQPADLLAYQKQVLSHATMQMVAVGQLPVADFGQAVQAAFGQWPAGKLTKAPDWADKPATPLNKTIALPDQASTTFVIAGKTGLRISDPDYLPFEVAMNALGGGFAGRLMKTVRDKEGLTYTIEGSQTAGHLADGYFTIFSTFNPALLAKGEASTLRELYAWADKGLSPAEFEHIRSNLLGSYQVYLANTATLATYLVRLLESGRPPEYFSERLAALQKLDVTTVNEVIKRRFNKDQLAILRVVGK